MKKLSMILLLGLLWFNTAFAEIITFPCTHWGGEPYHTFIIDMDKKIVDNEFKFLQKTSHNPGSRVNRVKIARFEQPPGTYLSWEGHLYEFFLSEKIAFLHIKKGMKKIQILKAELNGSEEDLFWKTDAEYREAGVDAISFDCDGDTTN